MKIRKIRIIIAIFLISSIFLENVPLTSIAQKVEKTVANEMSEKEKIIAGIASVDDIYGALDENTVPEIIGYDYAVKKTHIQRLYEQEGDELNKVVFLNADGSKTTYIYDFPVKYFDEKGKVQDITLEIESDDISGQFKSATGASITTFSRNISAGIKLDGNNESISLVPHLPLRTITSTNPKMLNEVPNSIAKKINDKTVSYDYDANTTIEYSLTYTGFKEDIVVKEYTGQTEYSFTLYTNGLKLLEMDDSFYLVDEQNTIKAALGDIIIFTADEKNNTMGDMVSKTIISNQEYVLTIVVDSEFLSDENTKYPIRIDPTVEICYDNNGNGGISDVTINSNAGSSATSTALSVGLRETYGISRILMKFPGLNLNSLGNNIRITSAAVEIRDLMCETLALDVSCYVFGGNEWNDTTANWSNVNPNSISTFLSSNIISYTNGTKQISPHRYAFDITEAVEGWKIGIYNPNKGIIFKAASSVENGTTYNCKTIASYNRSSYKPSLSVTYTETINLLDDGVYYLNNIYCGDYLRTISSEASVCSGLISTLGDSIRWEIKNVDGGYVIRSKTDTTKYLGVPASTSTSSVSIVTVTDTIIPTRCIWTFWITPDGGCLITNAYNSRHLYSHGDSLYTTSNPGNGEPGAYNPRVWRIVSTTYYGNSSSYNAYEVSAGTCIDFISAKVSHKRTPVVLKESPQEIWCSPSDFTYQDYSSIINIDPFTGEITAKSAGGTTVTAVHKVTNRSHVFTVYVSKLLIYQTENLYYYDKDGNYAEDMVFEDLTEEQLRELDWVNWSDFVGYTPVMHYDQWVTMCTTLFSTGELQDVIVDMINHFMDGGGSEYSNSTLTQKAYQHEATQTYIESIQEQIDILLDTYNGDMSVLTYYPETRGDHPLVVAIDQNATIDLVFDTPADMIQGLTICVDRVWGNKIQVTSFDVNENTYSYTLHYTLYDHFGLDENDVEKYGAFAGFRSWYILQHYSGYEGNYRPFLTLMEFDVTVTGTFS